MKPLLRRLINVERELERLGSEADRNALWVAASARVHEESGWDLVGVGIALPLTLYITSRGLGTEAAAWLAPLTGLPRWCIRVIGTALVFLVLVAIMALILRERYREAVRVLLKERGIPICLHCGYDLTGLTAPRCPECGAAAPAPPPPPLQ